MAEAEQFLSEGLNRRPYLTELPEEILTDIFAYVAIQKTTNPWPSRCLAGNYSARPLIYVCHRFYRLAIPLLYVNFAAATTDLEFVPPSDVVTSLHRTLVARPDFRRYCTTLSIYIPDVDARESTALDWKNAHEVITLLPNVQSLSLEGGFERYPTENWRLLRHATQCMEKLHSLTLSRECFNLSLMTFMRQEVDFAKLKSLTVNGFSNGWPTTESELVLEPNQIGASNLTSLQLLDFSARVTGLRQLLLWPQALQHFSFMNRNVSSNNIRLEDFASILAQHKSTLRSISLVYLVSNVRTTIDVTEFPCLQELTIDAYALKYDVGDAERCLLGPKLRKLTISFARWYSSAQLRDMSDEFLSFVHGFCHTAIQRKAALREIFIEFVPKWAPGNDGDADEMKQYIWEKLDKIRDEMEPRGMKFGWTKPPWTKEEMLQMCERAQKEKRLNEVGDGGTELECLGNVSE